MKLFCALILCLLICFVKSLKSRAIRAHLRNELIPMYVNDDEPMKDCLWCKTKMRGEEIIEDRCQLCVDTPKLYEGGARDGRCEWCFKKRAPGEKDGLCDFCMTFMKKRPNTAQKADNNPNNSRVDTGNAEDNVESIMEGYGTSLQTIKTEKSLKTVEEWKEQFMRRRETNKQLEQTSSFEPFKDIEKKPIKTKTATQTKFPYNSDLSDEKAGLLDDSELMDNSDPPRQGARISPDLWAFSQEKTTNGNGTPQTGAVFDPQWGGKPGSSSGSASTPNDPRNTAATNLNKDLLKHLDPPIVPK
eukprot:Platyproteum_vivax@DN4328_c0_g2_i1.p1